MNSTWVGRLCHPPCSEACCGLDREPLPRRSDEQHRSRHTPRTKCHACGGPAVTRQNAMTTQSTHVAADRPTWHFRSTLVSLVILAVVLPVASSAQSILRLVWLPPRNDPPLPRSKLWPFCRPAGIPGEPSPARIVLRPSRQSRPYAISSFTSPPSVAGMTATRADPVLQIDHFGHPDILHSCLKVSARQARPAA